MMTLIIDSYHEKSTKTTLQLFSRAETALLFFLKNLQTTFFSI